jgi:hypothetical protein
MQIPNLVGKYVKGTSALTGLGTKGQVVGSYVHMRKGFLSFIFGGSETIVTLIIRSPFGTVDEIRLTKPVDISDQLHK